MLEGHVSITLAGAPATLAPTLGAALHLTALHGNFGSLLAKLEAYDLKAAADVVHHGLGRTDPEKPRTTEEVFSTGLVGLTPDLIGYVIRLANGGKPLSDTEEGVGNGDAPFGV
ncbi:hypothetical protein J5J86_20715 [Aquabacter sp. L1I39]|uniref:hypothetical protein n=1 Tax=Aquabacter sp. L1I39 TaxID=2820278 RepID=UPI001ADB3076|nr:hypothetical protein [Aquabacter sp. L1I39]QTL03149.1 hypothetical protein J5J86_20715 [Aquabacter sp. L1I39]